MLLRDKKWVVGWIWPAGWLNEEIIFLQSTALFLAVVYCVKRPKKGDNPQYQMYNEVLAKRMQKDCSGVLKTYWKLRFSSCKRGKVLLAGHVPQQLLRF